MSPLAHAEWAHVQQLQEAQRYTGNSTVAVQRGLLMDVVPELTHVVQYEGAPWLVGALEELRSLKQAGVNIPFLGDFRIAEETMDHVRRLLTVEALRRLAQPQFIPFSGGGISLLWTTNNRELSFSIYPEDEEVTYTMGAINEAADNDGVVRINENRELASVVSRFLSSAA